MLPAGWSSSSVGVGVPWLSTAAESHSGPNSLFAPDPDNFGESTLDSPVFTPTVGGSVLDFWLNYVTEDTFDGVVLEVKIGAGAFQDIVAAGVGFSVGGYNGTIDVCCGNPLAGRSAWTGNAGGFTNVQVSLPPAAVGQSVQLRWRMGSDGSVSSTGVWLDDVEVRSPPGRGGGAYLTGGNGKQLVNVLLARNGATGNGAALYVENADALRLIHTTIAGPTMAANEAVSVAGGTVNLTNTLITSHTVGIVQVGGTVTEDYTLFDGVTTPRSGAVTAQTRSPVRRPSLTRRATA